MKQFVLQLPLLFRSSSTRYFFRLWVDFHYEVVGVKLFDPLRKQDWDTLRCSFSPEQRVAEDDTLLIYAFTGDTDPRRPVVTHLRWPQCQCPRWANTGSYLPECCKGRESGPPRVQEVSLGISGAAELTEWKGSPAFDWSSGGEDWVSGYVPQKFNSAQGRTSRGPVQVAVVARGSPVLELV